MALVMAFLAMVGCNHHPRLRNLRRHAMPVGFMITLVLLGVLVILALIRLRYFGSRLFILALPAGELPHFAIVYLGLSTLLAWHDSSLTGRVVTVMLGVAGLRMFGLFVLVPRGFVVSQEFSIIIC